MFEELYDLFKDDYIKVGRYWAKPFGPAWWIIRIAEGLIGVFGFYAFYILMWVLLG